MKWESGEAAPERTLLMGGPGSGKSHAVMSVAEMVDEPVHVLDTELDVYLRLNRERGLDNLDVTGVMPDDWLAMQQWAKDMGRNVGRGEVVVVDNMTSTWDAVAQWFAEDVLGNSLADLALSTRREQTGDEKNLKLMDGWRDYQVINKLYATFMNDLLRCTGRGAHVFMTSGMKDIPEGADRALRAVYGKCGAIPAGNKNLGHFPHTVIWMKRLRSGWEYETVKDQGRAEVEGDVSNFAKQYLAGVGGWKIKDGRAGAGLAD